MTATPIPRTLALTAYGDLDVTTPARAARRAGARSSPTSPSTDDERARAYERIREELDAGRQAFVVCPLVEESEALQARAATAEFERLRGGELKDYRVVLMHGQMRPREKQEAMKAFAAGGADVLVATTVIEVGIDVPNATVMLVEDAERYGLSQLHQLRGPDRPRRSTTPCACSSAPRSRAGCRRWPSTRTASAWPRSTSSCAGRGRCSACASPACRCSSSPACPRTSSCSSGPAGTPARSWTHDPELREPEHALIEDAIVRAYGADALEPIPA